MKKNLEEQLKTSHCIMYFNRMQLMLIHCQSRLPNVKYVVLTVSSGEIFHSNKVGKKTKPQAPKQKSTMQLDNCKPSYWEEQQK